MCPESWQDQYDLTQDSLPQSVRKLLGVLENVEKVVANSNAKKRLQKKTERKPPESMRKVSARVIVPWTTISVKRCESRKAALCQKHGGTHTTHNTGECHKYKKDGTLKKSFIRKAAIGPKRHGNVRKCNGYSKKENANSFAQLMERFSKLKKAVKKTQKSS